MSNFYDTNGHMSEQAKEANRTCLREHRAHWVVLMRNGNVRVHATASIGVMATSYNGNVTVTKAAGTSPQVMADTHNGRVSKP